MSDRWEAIVVGTGFGGAAAACRLSKRWPNNGAREGTTADRP